MSINQMTAVWKRSKQRGSKLLLLLAIADNANDAGEAWPGMEYLAKKTRMSKRHVRRMIQCLNETNELAVKYSCGRGSSNLYYILLDKTDDVAHEIKKSCALSDEKEDSLSPFGDDRKEDILSVKEDTQGVNGDILSVKEDTQGVKGDIAMSSEPLEPLKGNKEESSEPVGLDIPDIWGATLEQLKNVLPQTTFNNWFKGSQLFFEGETAVIVTKNQYGADWINAKLTQTVERCLNGVTNGSFEVYARPQYLSEGSIC